MALGEERKTGVYEDAIKSCVVPACVNGGTDLSVGMWKHRCDLRGRLSQRWQLQPAPSLLLLGRFSIWGISSITGETRLVPRVGCGLEIALKDSLRPP